MGDCSGPGISADLQGLRDFAAQVRGHTEGGLLDGSNVVYGRFYKGVVFGHGIDVSPVVRQAQQRCHTTLETGDAAYTRFIAEAQWLAKATEEMAATYGDADWASAANADQVKAVFDTGRITTGTSTPPAPGEGGSDIAANA